MKITKRQLRRIIKEELNQMSPEVILKTLVKKHAQSHAGQSINDNIDAALSDPMFLKSGLDEIEVADAIEAFYDRMMGIY